MLDPMTSAWLDQEDTHVAQTIRRYGWFIQYVDGGCCTYPDCTGTTEDNAPPFAYSIGLFGLGHPELLIIGVGMDTARGVINNVSERVLGGSNLMTGQLLTFPDWPHRVTVEEVPNPGDIAFAANRHYQRPAECSVPLLQLTYDDKMRRFPWDEGCAIPHSVQPRPGSFMA
jgi:hypothetical protein